MRYEDLNRRYGNYVSQRVRHELAPSEFDAIELEILPAWLEARAEAAHENYRRLLSNPVVYANDEESPTGKACNRWREAEDLAYLVIIANDVNANALANIMAG